MEEYIIAMMSLIFVQNMWELKKMFQINERLAKVEAKFEVMKNDKQKERK